MTTRAFVLSLCAGVAGVLLLAPRPARAYWVLYGYEITSDSAQKTLMLNMNPYTGGGGPTTMVQTVANQTTCTPPQGEKKTVRVNGVLASGSQEEEGQPKATSVSESSSITWGAGRNFLQDSPVLPGVQTASAKATLTVRSVFKWQRRPIYDGDNSTPDPTDNPPAKLWLLERAVISGGESTRQWDGNALVYFDTHPYKGTEYTFSNIGHPFKVPFTGTTAAGPLGANFSLDGSQVVCVPALPGGMAYGPSRKLSAQVNLSHILVEHVDRSSNGNVSLFYKAEPVKFAVLSRLKVDHDPNDLVTDFPLPTYQNYTQSSIAAGHKVTPVHEQEADLALAVQHETGWGYWGGVGNVRMKGVPAMKVDIKPGVIKGAALLPPTVPFDGTTHDGRIPLGRLLSRDKVTDSQENVHVMPKNSVGTATLVDHVWANVEWKFGNDGHTVWDELETWEDGDDGDAKWVYAKLTSLNDKPLVSHTIKFLVDYLEVDVTDDSGQKLTKIFTTDPNEAQQHQGTSSCQVVCQDDLSDLTSVYLSPPAQSISDNQGIVKGQISSNNSNSVHIMSYRFLLEDQGVFVKK